MKGKQSALLPGTEDRVGYWLTPPEDLAKIRAEFGEFFDPCPNPRPAGWDGLKEGWEGPVCYVNPPFEGPRTGFAGWARKCVAEAAKGKTVVLILPLDNWVRILVDAGAEIRSLGQTEWVAPDGKRRKSSRPNFHFVLRPRPLAVAVHGSACASPVPFASSSGHQGAGP